MPVVLLLGASGFIGRHVGAAFRALSDVDVIETAHRRPDDASGSPGRLDLAVDERPAIVAAIERARPAVIVNCVGRTAGTTSALTIANVETVAHLLEALQLVEGRPRLVHLGSAAEYGRGPLGRPVVEDAPAEPVSPYGESKLAATQLVRLARAHGSVDASVLRVFNVIGAGMTTDTLPGGVARQLVLAVRDQATSIRTGPLDAVRDFVDIADVADAVVAVSLSAEPPPPILNIGSGRGTSARALVDELARQAGFTGTISEEAAGSSRSAGVPWQVADIGLARETLGWQPSRTLEAMCRSVLSTALAGGGSGR